MLDEFREDRLERFRARLEAEGYEVADVESVLREPVTHQISGDEDDTLGFVVVDTPVELQGETFEGEVMVIVYKDGLSNHGVDVRSRPDDPLSERKRSILDDLVPPREVVDDDGETQLMWSYYPPPDDLPDTVTDGSSHNIDELMAEFESIYEKIR